MNTSIIEQDIQSLKAVSIFYAVGGAIGLLMSISFLSGARVGAFDAMVWMLLLAQLFFSIYGGWALWNKKVIGLQLLYWVSLSCIPVVLSGIVNYHSSIGVGAIGYFFAGPGSFSSDLNFTFGYSSRLHLFDGTSGVGLGINFIAIAMTYHLNKCLIICGINKRIVWKNRSDVTA